MEKVSKGGLKISIYGRPKSGKTRLACSFPKPLLILGTEDGTASVRSIERVDFLKIDQSSDFQEVLLNISNKYRSVVVDTASMLQDMVLAEVLGIEELPAQKSWGMATRDQYGQVALQTKTILRETLKLPLNVVIVAHERNFSEESGDGELLTPVVSSSLSPSVCRWLNGEVDYIAQCFVREETREKESTIAGKPTTVKSRTGKGEYCLRIGPHPCYVTGFRLSPGFELPDVITNPTYEKINSVICGEKVK